MTEIKRIQILHFGIMLVPKQNKNYTHHKKKSSEKLSKTFSEQWEFPKTEF